MDGDAIDEDSIDTATLQAQIDMSMAFAENLVSSWVKQSHKLPTRNSRDMEAELQEYMRRPPRLGVGAPIPETHSLSREIARLKGQLVGKGAKRPREEDIVSMEKSDDEEESRAGAIKKKARVDPFGEGKKKKKVAKAVVTPATPDTEKSEQEEVIGMIVEDVEEGTSLVPSTPRRKKRKRKLSVEGLIEDGLPARTSNEAMEQANHTTPLSPKILKVVDVPLIETPIISSRFQRSSQSEDIYKRSLLNLAAQSDEESDEPSKVETPVDGSNPKKKRKRRKKKKNAQIATVTDA